MKRFYKLVTHDHGADGYKIHLDGKPVKTPSGVVLKAPTRGLADAIVAEWAGQGDQIIMDSMKLTQLLGTAIDRVAQERAVMQETVLAYFDTDLLCYRTPAPSPLCAMENEAWDPWLAWFEKTYGYKLDTTTCLSALRHEPKAHEAVRAAVSAMDDLRFTVLQLVTASTGSLILAMAFVMGMVDVDAVFRAIRLDEAHKAVIYNEDFYGAAPQQEARNKIIREDLEACARFLTLLD